MNGQYLVGYKVNGYFSDTRVDAESKEAAADYVLANYKHAVAVVSVITIRKAASS